jgi:hypothetical protein
VLLFYVPDQIFLFSGKQGGFMAVIFALVVLLFSSCDILNNKPEGDLTGAIDDAVAYSRAPELDVTMDIAAGTGAVNPPPGAITPRPRQGYAFNVVFSPDAEYGFVEWRAWRASEPVKNSRTMLGNNQVSFAGRTARETTATVRLGGERIVIMPWCEPRPRILSANPPAGGSLTRVPTNYPVEIWFNVPVNPASINAGTVKISGKTQQGSGVTLPDLSGYFLPPVLDDTGTYLRIEAKPQGVPANVNVTVSLGPGICHRDYPAAVMEKTESLSYGANEGPDNTSPVLEFAKGAKANTAGAVFFSGTAGEGNDAFRLNREADGYYVYLFFDAYKNNGSLRDVRIVEERAEYPEDNRPFTDYELYRDEESPLALAYKAIYPEDKFPYAVRHKVMTDQEGIINFYIQPSDNLLNRPALADLRSGGKVVQAVLDLPPSPVSGLTGTYYRNTERLFLSWTDPQNADLDHLELQWGEKGGTLSVPAPVIKGGALTLPDTIPPDNKTYTLSLRTVDRAGNVSSFKTVEVKANAAVPSPVSSLQVWYDGPGEKLNVSWLLPAGEALAKVLLGWGRSGGAATTVQLGPSATSYSIPNIAEDGGEYVITLKTATAYEESAPVTARCFADKTPPGQAGSLSGVYDHSSSSLVIRWNDPPDTDLAGLYLDWGETLGTSTRVTVPAEGAAARVYAISGVAEDSSEYTVTLTAFDRAGNLSPPESVTVIADGTPPAAPTAFSAVYHPAGTITLSWTDPGDTDLEELRLEWNRNGEASTPVTVAGGDETWFLTVTPENGGLYRFSLRAADEAGNLSSAVTVEEIALSVPAGPVIQVQHTELSGQLLVGWTAVDGASAYEIRYGTGGDVNVAASAGESAALTRTISGLVNETSYNVWVRGRNAAGYGSWSNVQTGIPKNNETRLSSLMVHDVPVTGFSSAVLTGYTARVPHDAGNVTVAGTAVDSGATVTYSPAQPLTGLAEGDSVEVTVTVTARNGITIREYKVTVTKAPQTGITIVGPAEENIQVQHPYILTLVYGSAESLVFTVQQPELYSSITWYIDGSQEGTGAQFTIGSTGYIPRTYTLTVAVVKNGLLYSKDLSVTITP